MIPMSKIWDRLGAIQVKQCNGISTPCPRCGGALVEPMGANARSKHVLILICRICEYEEATSSVPKPIEHWHFVDGMIEESRRDSEYQPGAGGCRT